ncbi:MAG TPA: ATP-binding protein [bacterium]|nr:ATP-binding protein [bacterium]HOL47966.1 ATP-binding protein [bacterium]HPQ18046.1 ATP-binding protein [bacterium]
MTQQQLNTLTISNEKINEIDELNNKRIIKNTYLNKIELNEKDIKNYNLIFLKPYDLKEFEIFNKNFLPYLKDSQIIIISDNTEIINSSKNYNYFLMPEKNNKNLITALVNIILKTNQKEKEIEETKIYLTKKIDSFLLFDYALQYITPFFTTEDVITNILKLLINPNFFNFKEAYFYFYPESGNYKFYKNDNKNLLETSQPPQIIIQSFSENSSIEDNESFTVPLIIDNKLFGIFYLKFFENTELDLLSPIVFLIVKHIALKIKIIEYQTLNKELEKFNKTKSNFLILINHELRTPLTGLITSIDLLKDLINTISEKEMFIDILKILEVSSQQLYNIVENNLFFIKLLTNKVIAKPIELNPNDLITDILKKKENEIKNKKIELIISFTEYKNKYEIDKDNFQKAIEIIINNAIKFSTSKNPKIIIKTIEENNNCILTIEDNGIGMTKEELNRLFSKFEVLEDMAHHQCGLGINLCIAKLIIENLHNGKLEINSKKNIGTIVKIILYN